MKKTNIFVIILLMIVLTLTENAGAQITRQFNIGDNRNQTATNILVLPDGSGTIIAGYDYDIVSGAISNSQMILMKMDPTGTTLIWQQKFGISGKNNLVYNMIITHDNNIVVVGTIGRSGVYAGNIAAIMKFNSIDGSLLWQNNLHDAVTTSGGEIFYGVTELSAAGNYALIAVGSHNSQPGPSDAMLSMFDNTGTFVYDETYNVTNNSSDGFQNICTAADGKSVYICGEYNAPSGYDNGRAHYYMPGMYAVGPYVAGTMVWSKYFDYNLVGVSGKQNLTDNFFDAIYLSGSKLIIHGGSMHDYMTTAGEGETILRINAADGTSPELWQVENSGMNYANASKLFVVNSDHVVNVQAPTMAWTDPIIWLAGSQSNSIVTDITSLTAATVSTTPVRYKSSSLTPCLHSMLDITIAGTNIYMAGATNDPASGFGNNDIYLVQTPTTLPIDNAGLCDTSDVIWKSPVPVTAISASMNVATFNPVYVIVNPVPTNYQIGTLCTSISNSPCNGGSFDSVNTTLTDVGSTTADGSCVFQCTATGTTEPGWTIVEYLWNEGGTIVTDYTTAAVDNQVVGLPSSGSETVTVTYYAIDKAGDTCITTRTITLTCTKPPCYDTACTNLVVTDTLGNDSCVFTACANICTSYTIVGYDWSLSTGGGIITHHTSATNDCLTFTVPEGIAVAVSVVAHIVDFNYTAGTSPCCEADLSQQVVCNQNPKNRSSNGDGNISADDIAIFPNPTENAVTITSKQVGINNIQVIDVNGKKVGEYNYAQTQTANVSLNNLPAGTYLLRVNKSVSKAVTKIK